MAKLAARLRPKQQRVARAALVTSVEFPCHARSTERRYSDVVRGDDERPEGLHGNFALDAGRYFVGVARQFALLEISAFPDGVCLAEIRVFRLTDRYAPDCAARRCAVSAR